MFRVPGSHNEEFNVLFSTFLRKFYNNIINNLLIIFLSMLIYIRKYEFEYLNQITTNSRKNSKIYC